MSLLLSQRVFTYTIDRIWPGLTDFGQHVTGSSRAQAVSVSSLAAKSVSIWL